MKRRYLPRKLLTIRATTSKEDFEKAYRFH